MTDQVLAEVFGFPAENRGEEALRYRNLRLCPFNNRVPSCTKDKSNDPLGVCSIYEKGKSDDYLSGAFPGKLAHR